MVWLVLLALVVVAAVVGWRFMAPGGGAPSSPGIPAPSDEAATRIAAYRRLAEAKTLAGDGKHAEALPIFEEIARSEADPAYGWDARIQAAHSQGSLGQFEAALARFDRIIAECPYPDQVPGARIDRADVLSLAGRHDEAVGELDRLVTELTGQSDRICADALLAAARIHQRTNRPGLMRSALERISEDYPGDEDVCRNLANRALARLRDEYPARQERIIEEMAGGGGYHRVDELPAGTTTWTAEAGPYLVARPLTVAAGDSLHIGPGTQVRFAVNAGLRVAGTLEAAGTAEKPVRLLPLSDDPAKDWWSGIELAGRDGKPTVLMRQCRILGAEIGLNAAGGEARLESCAIERCGRAAVLAEGSTRLVIEECRLTDGGRVGVECRRGVALEMTAGAITRMKARGIVFRQSGKRSVIRGTLIEECGLEGILLQGDSAAAIESCRIVRNGASGVRGMAGARPDLSETAVVDNAGNGIWVEERWAGSVRGCTIKGNTLAGILAEVRCAGEIADNEIEANAGGGVCLRMACTTSVTNNRFVRNGGAGLILEEDSKPETERDNQFVDN